MQNPSDLQSTEVSVPVDPHAERPEKVSRVPTKAFDSAKKNVLGKRHSSLIKQAAEGDTEALTLLLRAARPLVFDWASQMTGDPDEAEDITQTVLIRIWFRLPGFRGDSRISSWLYRITFNQVSENRRKERARVKKTRAWAVRSAEPDECHQISALDFEVLEEYVRDLARDLPPLQRAIFRLVDLEGLKPCEAAQRLDRTQTTIRSSLCRARKKVRQGLEESGGSLALEWVALAS